MASLSMGFGASGKPFRGPCFEAKGVVLAQEQTVLGVSLPAGREHLGPDVRTCRIFDVRHSVHTSSASPGERQLDGHVDSVGRELVQQHGAIAHKLWRM